MSKWIKDRKTITFVCPKKCGNTREMNLGVKICLCENCGYIQMIHLSKLKITNSKDISQKKIKWS